MNSSSGFTQRPARSTILCLIAAVLSVGISGCEALEADTNEVAHKTQIVVELTGRHALTEEFTVSIDGQSAGIANSVSPVVKEVEAGEHTISATSTRSLLGYSAATVKVLEGQTFRYQYPLNDVSITFHSRVNKPRIIELQRSFSGFPDPNTLTLPAGGTVVHTGGGGMFVIYVKSAVDPFEVVQTITGTIPYGSTLRYEIDQ